MKPPSGSRRRFLASCAAACSLPALAGVAAGSQEKQKQDKDKEVAWLAEVQRRPDRLPADTPQLSPLLVGEDGREITSFASWQRQREKIKRWWLDFLKPFSVDRKGPPPLEVVAEDRPQGAVRQLLRYEVEPGLPVEAYLLKPAKLQPPVPGVVVLHPTVKESIRQPAGVEGKPEMAFGLRLARRGCVAICPRNFLWPETNRIATDETVKPFNARHPGSKGMAKMLFDAVVALDILAGLPEVDPKRLGAIGHSLGAKEALYLAALDERIRVTVSSEGGIGTRYSNWEAPWYLGSDIRSPAFRHEHHELLALVAPRPFLLLGGDSADGDRSWPFIEAVLPVYRLYGSTPRVGLFNHRKGHNVPPEAEERIDQWFEAYL